MDLGGGAEAKIKLFQNMVMLHIKLKLTTGSNMVAIILPTDTPSTPCLLGVYVRPNVLPVNYIRCHSIWASSRENLSLGFQQSEFQTSLLSYRDKLEN